MADESVRELERLGKSGDADATERFVRAQLRANVLTIERVRLAAHFGDVGCRRVLVGDTWRLTYPVDGAAACVAVRRVVHRHADELPAVLDLKDWLGSVEFWSEAAVSRVGVSLARLGLAHYRSRSGPQPEALSALVEAGEAFANDPTPAHRAAVNQATGELMRFRRGRLLADEDRPAAEMVAAAGARSAAALWLWFQTVQEYFKPGQIRAWVAAEMIPWALGWSGPDPDRRIPGGLGAEAILEEFESEESGPSTEGKDETPLDRVASGRTTLPRLSLAAHMGHEAARKAIAADDLQGEWEATAWRLRMWLSRFEGLAAARRRVAIAIARLMVPVWERDHRSSAPRDALEHMEEEARLANFRPHELAAIRDLAADDAVFGGCDRPPEVSLPTPGQLADHAWQEQLVTRILPYIESRRGAHLSDDDVRRVCKVLRTAAMAGHAAATVAHAASVSPSLEALGNSAYRTLAMERLPLNDRALVEACQSAHDPTAPFGKAAERTVHPDLLERIRDAVRDELLPWCLGDGDPLGLAL